MEAEHEMLAATGADVGATPAMVKVRWKPNEEQLRILVRLFEEEGDSINKQRIKEIAVELGRQGDVTEANVHNWFHNRKARAKRKQRLALRPCQSADSRKRLRAQHHPQALLPELTSPSEDLRSALRLPSDGVTLAYESSMAALTTVPTNFSASDNGLGLAVDEPIPCRYPVWKSHALNLHPSLVSSRGFSPMDRDSESKTITDDDASATTESEEEDSRKLVALKSSSVPKRGKGTMIRRPAANGGTKGRISDIMTSLEKNTETYEQDLRALFAEIVKRLGTGTAKVMLSRRGSSSDSDTASPPRHRASASSPIHHAVTTDLTQQRYICGTAYSQEPQEITPFRKQISAFPNSSEDSGDVETDVEEEFRIVWSSPKQAEERAQKQQQQARTRRETPAKMMAAEGEKVNIVLTDGKPSGPEGTWWNSMLRHSALLFLDISIPHIGLQPEEGLSRIRDYLNSKFVYTGGSLDDAYLKKQVAKALNFRRHKVMRLIEQGASRPNNISEEQWNALIKYYADPKRREKSDKQRAALKALNMNNHLQHAKQQEQTIQQELVCHQQHQCELGDPDHDDQDAF
uniref:Wuschel-like homeobox 13E n=1 Tax=Selaginella kraussiana TaxID=81964 RepID=A0A0P0LAI8_9TRAC|nr:wuschel-like homeobox 13E [Selaginella kraussiana]